MTTRRPPLPPCTECGWALTRNGVPLEPGTRRHAGNGLCGGCAALHRRRRRGVAPPRTWRPFTPPPLWTEQAACRQQELDPDLFFPEPHQQVHETIRAARWVCGRCPVQTACLKFALDNNEAYGVWGGLTVAERRQIRRAGQAGGAAHGAA